ncbi:MAG: metallophosphoesterase [Lentisphaerae bacterium]|jgi:predicted MPP superfamily phosphohydrolase|nr:metallophosphoesterase [Lentisphaerota bacterium]
MNERMGERAYARRRKIERGRLIEYHLPVSPRMTALKIRVIRPILTLGLRVLGLYRHGYRQFHNIRVRRNTLAIRRLPDAFEGFTLLQMSDLHIDLDPSLVDSVAATIAGLQYDVCVITGDFRNSTIGTWDEVVPPMKRLVEQIRAPVYAVLGNHDFADMVGPLEETGMRFLLNESAAVERDGTAIYLVGIDDPNLYATHDFDHALRSVPSDAIRILLTHSPVIYGEAAARGFAALLAGHTHGGQICLPWGGIVVRNDRSPRRFLRGAWRHGDLQGYTSSGTGSCGIPLRFNCPPEVTLHTLRRA